MCHNCFGAILWLSWQQFVAIFNQHDMCTCLLRHFRDTEKAVVLYRFYYAMLHV